MLKDLIQNIQPENERFSTVSATNNFLFGWNCCKKAVMEAITHYDWQPFEYGKTKFQPGKEYLCLEQSKINFHKGLSFDVLHYSDNLAELEPYNCSQSEVKNQEGFYYYDSECGYIATGYKNDPLSVVKYYMEIPEFPKE